jgi:para-aminobenzoate synthetase
MGPLDFPHDKLAVTAWHDLMGAPSDNEDTSRTIQAIEGIDRPVWGVQFHPEVRFTRRSTQIHGSNHYQSIASSHGADILCSFLRKTHAFHGRPESFPALSRRVLELSPVNHGLDVNEPSRPISHMQDDPIEKEDGAMLESVSETFQSTAMRSDVDAEEMFMQLIEKVDSPLGHVWLDGVSVSLLPSMSRVS